jgi:sialate O-acetylesterase
VAWFDAVRGLANANLLLSASLSYLVVPMKHLLLSVAFFLFLMGGTVAQAEISLPAIFSDHMVLQQKQSIRVWGWGEKGEAVKVSLGKATVTTEVNASGRWEVKLPALEASKESLTLVAEGKNKVEFKDVLIGEVWLCSGQSNMEWPVAASSNAQEEIAAAKYPMIRHIKVPLVQSNVPLDNFNGSWQVCSPETAAGFTACGYFMARKLNQELDIPIGLINSSWGGTRVEPWTPPIGFQRVGALQDIYQSVMGRTPGTPAYIESLEKHIAEVDAWSATAKQQLKTNAVVMPSPSFPAELTPFASNQDPTMLYNGMIHSIVGYGIRGAIWYQGESNHAEGMLYLEKKKALIGGWRELWGSDFPFYYVQIAPYHYGSEDPTILAKFWEAQAAVQSIPKTGMVVINDIATVNDIHPPNKQDVGLRLALLALKNDYGKADVVAHSPEVAKLELAKEKLIVHFKNSGGGLKTRDGKEATHFEVIGVGADGFQPAKVEIKGDTVVLTSDKVKEPVAFRFAWNKLAEPNLCGSTGLPVGACRGGEVPDFFSMIPGSKEYRLVYDLDLSKLDNVIKYDVDRSGEVKSFERVAYLLELTAAGGEEQKMFVAMDAFTKNAKQLGVPTFSSGGRFQQVVQGLEVYSNVASVAVGKFESGNIEFWPDNYTTDNVAMVTGAAGDVYDWGDGMFPPEDGYGSMQIHNPAKGQTLMALNHWRTGAGADLGIGNSTGQTRDWTFTGNAGTYSNKRLRIFVR